jgi:RNA polymerase sigma factor (TIGR02999 family)
MANLTPECIAGALPDPAGLHRQDAVSQLQANYNELRHLAASFLQLDRRNHTLQPTALVHEVYLRLASQCRSGPYSRVEFLAAASTVMRRILVDYARLHRAAKRGSGQMRSRLDEALSMYEDRSYDLVALNDVLEAMASANERMSRIVQLRFFGGMTMREIAQHLRIPTRTVERDWTMAKAWLMCALGSD